MSLVTGHHQRGSAPSAKPTDGHGGPQELLLEVDGPGLHPSSVDAVAFLELAAAYFSLVAVEAASTGFVLRFEGIQIRDKCAAFAVQVSNGFVAQVAAVRTARVIQGEEPPPKGGVDHVRRFQKAARCYDHPGHSISAMGTTWKIPIVIPKETRPRPMDSLEVIRVKALRVGGREPAVRFSSELEREVFTLRASEDLARALGNQLYRDVEIDAQIERDRDGHIIGGQVLSFAPVDVACEDPWDAWMKWHHEINRAAHDSGPAIQSTD